MKCSNRQRSQYKFYYPHNIVITGKTAFPVNTCFMAMDGDEPHCLPIHSLMLIFDQQFHCRPIFSTCPVPTTDPPYHMCEKHFVLTQIRLSMLCLVLVKKNVFGLVANSFKHGPNQIKYKHFYDFQFKYKSLYSNTQTN